MDGTYQYHRDSSTQNHAGGQNVLFVDGRVSWESRNFCSNEPTDNVYSESGSTTTTGDTGWHADTDSFICNVDWEGVDNDTDWRDGVPNGLGDGLGESFNSYYDLQW